MDKYKVDGNCTILDFKCGMDCSKCEAPEDEQDGRIVCPHHCCLYDGALCNGFDECDQ